jgi:hypothetical protein
MHRIVIVSDIHYASEGEKARRGHEGRVIRTWPQKLFARLFRRLIWLKDPLAHNHLLDDFCLAAGEPDLTVANGDYSCDSAFVGVSDDAACASARIVLERLRGRFPDRLAAIFGDHELGKTSLFGGVGGPRLASWRRATDELGLEPFWRRELGDWVLLGVVSSLLALPVFEPETLPDERVEWRRLRENHLDEIRAAFADVKSAQRVVLFCHDPTAIPFLWREVEVRARLSQVDCTVIGHLHTPLILWKSRALAGMPAIHFLGNSVRRMSTALREARTWRDFKVRLCPSLAGCQLLKDGGFCSLELPEDRAPARWRFHPLPWRAA